MMWVLWPWLGATERIGRKDRGWLACGLWDTCRDWASTQQVRLGYASSIILIGARRGGGVLAGSYACVLVPIILWGVCD
jgi:hypothetical protein